jgi:uncharacterized protein involved in exopolysaccharide biosynthesis
MIGAFLTLIQDEARRIWCHRWLGLLCGAVILAAGTFYVLTMGRPYDAWAQIYVDKQTPVTEAARAVSLGGEGFSTQVVERTLLNDQNLEKLVRETNPKAAQMSRAEMAKAVTRLRDQIRVTSDGDGFVEFHYVDTNPVRAAHMAKRLMDQFIASNVERSRNELAKAETFLDDQIAAYKVLLADSQSRLDELRRAHAGLAALPLSASAAVGPAAFADDTEEVVVSAPGTAARATSAKAAAAAERVASLQAKLDQLKSLYTDEYPDVVSTKRQLADAVAAQQLVASERPSASQVSASAGPVRRVIRRPRAAPVLPPGVAAEWADAQRNAEMLRTNYQQLIARREATRMSLAVFGSDTSGKFQVTRAPVVPTVPTGPRRRLYFAGVLVAATVGGLAAAYLRGAIRGILVSPRELELACQLPVIGTVSWEPAWSTVRRRRGLDRLRQGASWPPRPRALAWLRSRRVVGDIR